MFLDQKGPYVVVWKKSKVLFQNEVRKTENKARKLRMLYEARVIHKHTHNTHTTHIHETHTQAYVHTQLLKIKLKKVCI